MKLKNFGKRAISFLMVFAMMLGFLPAFNLFAKAEGESGGSGSDGIIHIDFVPIDGNGEKGNKVSGSITATVLMSKSGDGTYVKDKSAPEVWMYITFTDIMGHEIPRDPSNPIYYKIEKSSDGATGPNSAPQKDKYRIEAPNAPISFALFDAYKSDITIYISANTADGKHYTAASIDFKIVNEAKRLGPKYSKFGMQVRVIDGDPLGPYDYELSQGKKVSNVRGKFTKETGYYTSELDHNTYPNYYMDIQTHTRETLDDPVGSILNLDDFLHWYETVYLPNSGKSAPTTGSITVSGPAYIELYDDTSGTRQKWQEANLEYYTETGSNKANKYAGWGNKTRADFVQLRYITMIIPLRQTGGVTINCYDEETNKLLYTKKIPESELDKYQAYPQKADFESIAFGEGTPWREMLNIMAAAATGPSETWWANRLSDLKTLSKLERDPVSGEIREKAEPIANEETLKQLYAKHQYLANEYQRPKGADTSKLTGTKGSPLAKAITVADIKFPTGEAGSAEYVDALKGYVLDFGLAQDASIPVIKGIAVPIIYKADAGMKVSVSQATQTAVVDLYYLKAGAPYQIKIRLDGEIDETLTRSYPIRFDEEGNPLPVPEDDPTVEKSKELVK